MRVGTVIAIVLALTAGTPSIGAHSIERDGGQGARFSLAASTDLNQPDGPGGLRPAGFLTNATADGRGKSVWHVGPGTTETVGYLALGFALAGLAGLGAYYGFTRLRARRGA